MAGGDIASAVYIVTAALLGGVVGSVLRVLYGSRFYYWLGMQTTPLLWIFWDAVIRPERRGVVFDLFNILFLLILMWKDRPRGKGKKIRKLIGEKSKALLSKLQSFGPEPGAAPA